MIPTKADYDRLNFANNEAFKAASKLIVDTTEMLHEKYVLEILDLTASSYLCTAERLREACIDAPGMMVAGLVLMADHYKARGLAQKAFVHQCRCRPYFQEVARRSGIQM